MFYLSPIAALIKMAINSLQGAMIEHAKYGILKVAISFIHYRVISMQYIPWLLIYLLEIG